MEKVKEFLNSIFRKELEALYLECFKEKIKEYNSLVENEINIYCEDYYDKKFECKVEFNLIGKLLSPWDDDFYDDMKNAPYPNPRHLYKISHYQNNDYGNVWACYVSTANPYMDTKRINDCFIVTEINGELKIIANFGPDIDQPKWKFYAGDRELKMNNLGKLQTIERIMEPTDEWSLQEYLKNK